MRKKRAAVIILAVIIIVGMKKELPTAKRQAPHHKYIKFL